MPSFTSSLVASLALFAGTNAHMVMRSPTPYGAATLSNGPLAADGSDFPCKQRAGVYDAAGVNNVMPIGAPQTLAFKGEAVHGGGSCQISLTRDLKPTKDSKWMVIHSIEGDCPAKAAGNLGDDAGSTTAASTFQYSIPQGINTGQYTLAWTWFNKIGNREMYMNCAPITVTGGSKKRDADDAHSYNATAKYGSDEIIKRDTSFPDMFLANLFGTGPTACQTVPSTNLIFPDPGTSVQKAADAAPSPSKGTTAGICPGSFSGGSSGSSASAGASGSTPSAASGSGSGTGSSAAGAAGAASPSPTSIVAIPPPSASGMGMASAAVSVASAAQSVASAAASVASGAGMVSPATATGSASSGSSGSGSGSDSGSTPSSSGSASSGSSSSLSGTAGGGAAAAAPGSMPCSSPGQTVCSSDGMKFGTCDTNKMAVMMAVASGTKCSGGQITAAGTQKRSAKFARLFNA
ncbi:MAG: hypothetical protein Q9202_000307 [Teloschistes flavicans]